MTAVGLARNVPTQVAGSWSILLAGEVCGRISLGLGMLHLTLTGYMAVLVFTASSCDSNRLETKVRERGERLRNTGSSSESSSARAGVLAARRALKWCAFILIRLVLTREGEDCGRAVHASTHR